MNKDALRQLQKSMRQSRLNEMNPMGTSRVMQIKESYVKKDSLQALEEAVIASLAKIRAEIDRIDQDSRIALKEAKNSLSGDIKKTENSLSERLKKEIQAVAHEVEYTGGRIDQISTKLPKILSMPVQRQLSIPVALDEGGTGATTAAQARANLGITSGSGITRSITVTSGNVTAGDTADVDYVYLVSGAHTVTLPTAVSNTNRYTVKNNHSVNITIGTTSAQTIDGTTTISLAPEESVDIISTNTNWSLI